MIRNWVEAMGDANPVYTDAEAAAASVHGGLVAPPAMVQVWTMRGLHPVRRATDDPLGRMIRGARRRRVHLGGRHQLRAGVSPLPAAGEQVTVRASLEGVTGPKRTALGEGWFVTTRSTWYAGDEPVAAMLFRVLKFRPRGARRAPRSARPRPSRRARAAAR